MTVTRLPYSCNVGCCRTCMLSDRCCVGSSNLDIILRTSGRLGSLGLSWRRGSKPSVQASGLRCGFFEKTRSDRMAENCVSFENC